MRRCVVAAALRPAAIGDAGDAAAPGPRIKRSTTISAKRRKELGREWLPQEFVYTKNVEVDYQDIGVWYNNGTTTLKKVVVCAHVFSLGMREIQRLSSKNLPGTEDEAHAKPVLVMVIPLVSHACPTFWPRVEDLCQRRQIDGAFCEGSTEDYTRRDTTKGGLPLRTDYRLKTEHRVWKYKSRWEEWRQRRAPWPWGFRDVKPKLHGGDTVEYGWRQRLFPACRPGPAGDAARAAHCVDKMYSVGQRWHHTQVATLWHYRFAPLIAADLTERGYDRVLKEEIVVATEVMVGDLAQLGIRRRAYPSFFNNLVQEVEGFYTPIPEDKKVAGIDTPVGESLGMSQIKAKLLQIMPQ